MARTGHEQHGVDAQKPVPLEHLPSLMEEDLGLVLRRVPTRERRLLRADEDLALGQEQPHKRRERGDAGRAPEERAPCRRRLRNEVQVDHCFEQLADRVALLEDTRGETTDFYGQVFERGGCSKTPDTAHSDTEERADGKELLEGLDKAGSELKGTTEEEVGDERPPTVDSV